VWGTEVAGAARRWTAPSPLEATLGTAACMAAAGGAKRTAAPRGLKVAPATLILEWNVTGYFLNETQLTIFRITRELRE
jgi:hypothetical protein